MAAMAVLTSTLLMLPMSSLAHRGSKVLSDKRVHLSPTLVPLPGVLLDVAPGHLLERPPAAQREPIRVRVSSLDNLNQDPDRQPARVGQRYGPGRCSRCANGRLPLFSPWPTGVEVCSYADDVPWWHRYDATGRSWCRATTTFQGSGVPGMAHHRSSTTTQQSRSH